MAKGRPLSPVFMWADTRSAPDARALRQEISEKSVHARTGCMLRAPFWPAKLRWLRRTQPALFKRTARWVSPADWVFRELFGSALTSHSMASGTGLYDLPGAKWHARLCELCSRPPRATRSARRRDRIPRRNPRGTSRRSRFSRRSAMARRAISDRAPIAPGASPSPSARVAPCGRSCHGAQPRPRIPFGLFRFVVDEARVVLGGAVSNGGNLHQWCVRELKMSPARAEQALDRRAATTDTLTVLPFWVNERAPDLAGGFARRHRRFHRRHQRGRNSPRHHHRHLLSARGNPGRAPRTPPTKSSSPAAFCIRAARSKFWPTPLATTSAFVPKWKARSAARLFSRWRNSGMRRKRCRPGKSCATGPRLRPHIGSRRQQQTELERRLR